MTSSPLFSRNFVFSVQDKLCGRCLTQSRFNLKLNDTTRIFNQVENGIFTRSFLTQVSQKMSPLKMCRNVKIAEKNSIHRQSIRCFGAGDLKSVSARMKSVKSIQKITKAMKMVAASKLKGDQKRLENGTIFTSPIIELFGKLKTPADDDQKSRVAIIALTSDKGLCGAVNSSVGRMCRNQIVNYESAKSSEVSLIGFGEKIKNALFRNFGDRFYGLYTEMAKLPFSFASSSIISDALSKSQFDKVVIIYNHFRSTVSYETQLVRVMTKKNLKGTSLRDLDVYEFEPEKSDILPDLHDFYLCSIIYNIVLDGIASEQSARMSAMDNASSNAGEMLDGLTLRYNRARQAKITLELIEIISGVNAL